MLALKKALKFMIQYRIRIDKKGKWLI